MSLQVIYMYSKRSTSKDYNIQVLSLSDKRHVMSKICWLIGRLKTK